MRLQHDRIVVAHRRGGCTKPSRTCGPERHQSPATGYQHGRTLAPEGHIVSGTDRGKPLTVVNKATPRPQVIAVSSQNR